jgi:hypothetical protein
MSMLDISLLLISDTVFLLALRNIRVATVSGYNECLFKLSMFLAIVKLLSVLTPAAGIARKILTTLTSLGRNSWISRRKANSHQHLPTILVLRDTS